MSDFFHKLTKTGNGHNVKKNNNNNKQKKRASSRHTKSRSSPLMNCSECCQQGKSSVSAPSCGVEEAAALLSSHGNDLNLRPASSEYSLQSRVCPVSDPFGSMTKSDDMSCIDMPRCYISSTMKSSHSLSSANNCAAASQGLDTFTEDILRELRATPNLNSCCDYVFEPAPKVDAKCALTHDAAVAAAEMPENANILDTFERSLQFVQNVQNVQNAYLQNVQNILNAGNAGNAGNKTNTASAGIAAIAANMEDIWKNKQNSEQMDSSDSDSDSESSADVNMQDVSFVSSKLVSTGKKQILTQERLEDGCYTTPAHYNEFTSCVAEGAPAQVLETTKTLLLKYIFYSVCEVSDVCNVCNVFDRSWSSWAHYEELASRREVDHLRVDTDDFCIHGTVYLRHKPVKFCVSVWHETRRGRHQTRVEFQKRRGDALLFQQFWYEMLELMHAHLTCVSGATRCPNFASTIACVPPSFPCISSVPSLVSLASLPSLASTCVKDVQIEELHELKELNEMSELDGMAWDLRDDYRDEALETLALMCEEMERDEFKNRVARHEKLLKALVDAVLNHFDTCHVRGGLCALTALMSVFGDDKGLQSLEWFVAETKVLARLAKLVTHESEMIAIRARRLLAMMAQAGQKQWNANANRMVSRKDIKRISAWTTALEGKFGMCQKCGRCVTCMEWKQMPQVVEMIKQKICVAAS